MNLRLTYSKRVVVIAGPAGSGKNSVVSGIMKRCSNCVRLVTATTRAMRPGERDGADYYFFTPERFDEETASGNIPERRFVPVLNVLYGTYLPDLKKRLAEKDTIIFATVDIEGARYLKDNYGATTLFIMPESVEQFEGRLRVRNPEWSDEEFSVRQEIAEKELHAHVEQYDYRIVNADGELEETVDNVVAILKKEGYNLIA